MVVKKRQRKAAKPPTNRRKSLSPETTPAEPGVADSLSFVWLPKKVGSVLVTEQTALTCASVWACVRVISEGLAKLPWRVFKKTSAGRNESPDHPADWLLKTQANPETPAFQFREALIAHALTWGNGYAEIERTMTGRPVWLWQITPDRVCVDRDSQGNVVYDIRNHREPNTVLGAEDVFHLKGLGFDGLVGYSVIAMAAKTIGGAMAAETAASDLWENDTTPGGILEYAGKLSDQARANVRKTWTERHGGAKNRRRLAILEQGLKWVATALPPDDAQLLQSRQYSPLEICRIFRVQPHKIAELTRATFSNIYEQNQEHVDDTLMPWAVRCEQEADMKLIAERDQRTFYTKYNFDSLLRGKTTERAEFYAKLHGLGVLSVNEIRAKEDLNSIGPDGDKRFVPLNMQLLEKAGEEPPAPADNPTDQPMPPEEKPMPDSEMGDMAENMSVALSLLQDSICRVLRREQHRLEDAAKRMAGNLSAANAWHAEFLKEHAAYLRDQLARPMVAAARLAGMTSQQSLDGFEGAYCADARERAAKCFEGTNGFDADAIALRYATDWLAALKGNQP